MPKIIDIPCTDAILKILVDSLKLYAELAFPVTGSECNLVARDALITAANKYILEQSESGSIQLSSRIKPMLKAAINTYYKIQTEQSGAAHTHECELLLTACEGESVSDQQLQEARQKDIKNSL